MRSDLSEIICIVDRSGSMESIRGDAMGGYNAFLAGQKAHPGRARFTLVLFDHEFLLVHDGVDIDGVPPLDQRSYVPRGSTALLDAIGRTIDDAGARLARTPEAERPGKVIVAILTDGMENASRTYSRERVSDMISHQQSKYSWEFIFLAANQDAISTAQTLSIDASSAISFAASGAGVRSAFAAMETEVSARRNRQ
jgi:hypothetical protein